MARDSHGRSIDYLRVSVTDRCNLRCVYCMPAEGVDLKLRQDIVSLEEIYRVVQRAANYGIHRIRLTGGEPLVRLGLPGLIARIRKIDGIEDVSLTTNGILLPKYAAELKEAGLDRVNISIDTLDPVRYGEITRGGNLDDVLHAIDVALEYDFSPIKLNMVVMYSEHQDLYELASLSKKRPLHIRFIEYMPVGKSSGVMGDGWRGSEVVTSENVIKIISNEGEKNGIGGLLPIADSSRPTGGGPARYFTFGGAAGTVGVISPLSNHFCGQCNRLRLTSDGKLRPCLFSDLEFDLLGSLRSKSDKAIDRVIEEAIDHKPKNHQYRQGTYRKMSQIGG